MAGEVAAVLLLALSLPAFNLATTSLTTVGTAPVTYVMTEYLPPATLGDPYPLGRARLSFPEGTPDQKTGPVPGILTLTFAYRVDTNTVSGTCRAEARRWTCRLQDGFSARLTIAPSLTGIRVDFPRP